MRGQPSLWGTVMKRHDFGQIRKKHLWRRLYSSRVIFIPIPICILKEGEAWESPLLYILFLLIFYSFSLQILTSWMVFTCQKPWTLSLWITLKGILRWPGNTLAVLQGSSGSTQVRAQPSAQVFQHRAGWNRAVWEPRMGIACPHEGQGVVNQKSHCYLRLKE